MYLHDLLLALPDAQVSGLTQIAITALAYDSRAVQPGSLYVAIRGFHTDGHAFIAQALDRGAVAVVVDQPVELPASIAKVTVADSRVALAPIAAAFYGHPGQHMRVVGITGTDGKTTTTFLTSAVLEAGGHTTGLLGTVDFKVGARQWANDTRQSTPEAPEVQALLRDMVAAGCDYAVLEATSHALSARWNRLGGAAFDLALLTNVTHEHLDFHGSVEQYRRDKARLFEMLGESGVRGQGSGVGSTGALEHPSAPNSQLPTPNSQLKARKVAIVNADDPHHRMFLDAAPASATRLTYGINQPADVRAHDLVSSAAGLRFRVETPWGLATPQLKLTGDFNVANALAALTVGLAEGVPLHVGVRALEAIPGVRGRMERIDMASRSRCWWITRTRPARSRS